MIINKQLFEDVLSGKLKGTFVLRNGDKVKSSKLSIDTNADTNYPIFLNGYWYANQGEFDLTRNSNIDIIDFIQETNMKENELTIEIPDGKIVDWEESKKQNKIVLKDKQLSYEEVCKKLFWDGSYFIGVSGSINKSRIAVCAMTDPNNATTEHQLECLLAKNKLANVAIFLNDGWKPTKCDHTFAITCLGNNFDNKLIVGEYYFGNGENLIVFKTQKAAQQAIEILGEETVKLALEPLGI